MQKLRNFKIAYKLPLFVVFFSILLTGTIATLTVMHFEKTAISQAENKFKALVAARREAVEKLLQVINADIISLSMTPSTITALQRFSAAWSNMAGEATNVTRATYITDNPFPVGEKQNLDRGEQTIPYNIHHAHFHPSFRAHVVLKGYYDAFLVSPAGDVVYSVYKEDDYSTNLLNGAYKDSDLGELFRGALELQDNEAIFSDIAPYAASAGGPAAFVATKVVSNSGQTVGVMMLQLPTALIDTIMNDSRGIGDTVEAFLTGADFIARSNSRMEGGHTSLEQLSASPHLVDAAEDHGTFTAEGIGLRGQPVAAYAEHSTTFGTDWIVAIEQDRAELMAPVIKERNILIAIATALATALSFVGWLFARSITQPLDQIRLDMEAVSSGNLATEVSEANRGDEIGSIGKTLLSMQKDLQQARNAEEQRAAEQQEQQVVVEHLSAGLVRLAEGDFTQPIDQAFSGEHEKLRQNYNQTIETLSGTVSQVIDATASIRNGAAEISRASDDLSHRTESQAATLEETAAALDELTASVNSAAEGARSVEATMESARNDAVASSDVVKNAVSAMTEIEQSSNQISQIITVIDDIAFQTNLLALNAGVEAARAGEAGRGFAVVASEVRGLAQRSADAATEIKTLITDSGKQVTQGVELVGKTGEALSGIVERIGHISKLVSGIAEGAVEQSTGLNEINTGVIQLDQVTQQNAAMVEEATAAGQLLSTDSTQLAQLVSAFKIKGGATVVQMQVSAPTSAAEEIDPSAHGSDDWNMETSVASSSRSVTDGNTARDTWEDF